MMSKKELCSLYSVFVGHLSLSVTKTDLVDLFSGCGEIEDVFICDNNSSSPYLYGFVRFRDIESVYKSVKTLHRWPLKGNKIVVDIAKDTGDRIKKGGDTFINVNKLMSTPSPSAPLVKEHPPSVASSNIIQDVMHLGRLKECYASLAMEAKYNVGSFADKKTVSITDMETFMEDVEQASAAKSATYEGKIQKTVSPELVNQALLNSDDLDPAFGMNRANHFLSSLKVVMGNMASFLKDHDLMSSETAELVNLCAGESEEKYSDESSHASTKDRKIYRNSALKERLKQPETSDSEISPVYEPVSVSDQKRSFEESAGNTSRCSESELVHSNQGRCLPIEPHEFADDEMSQSNVNESDDRIYDEGEEVAETITKGHVDCQEYEMLSKDENSEEVDDVFSLVSFKSRDGDLKTKKSAISLGSSPGKRIESKEDQKLSSTSSLSSHSTASEGSKLPSFTTTSESAKQPPYSTASESTKLSNDFRPKSPVSPDIAIISSALHSKKPQTILKTKPVADQQGKASTFVHSKSSPSLGTSFMKTSPTFISSSLKKVPSPPRMSSGPHSNSPPNIPLLKQFPSASAHLKSSPTIGSSYPTTLTSANSSSVQKLPSPPFPSHVLHSKSPQTNRDSVHDLDSSPKEMPVYPETKTYQTPTIDYKICEHDAEVLSDEDSCEKDKIEAQSKEHVKSAKIETISEKESFDEVDEDLISVTFELEIKDDDGLEGKVNENENPLESGISATDQESSHGGEDLKSSSASSLSSYSLVNAKLSRSNYYRPFSPVSSDMSLSMSSSEPIFESQTGIKGLRQSDSTTSHVTSQPNMSSTVLPTSSLEMPSPSSVSSADHTNSRSSSNSYHSGHSSNASTTEIPVQCEFETINTPIQHEKFHESISDSEARSSQKSKPSQSLNSDISDNEAQVSPVTSPRFGETQKLDLGELFGLCNGQKQEVVAEKVSLDQIFSMCNGQTVNLSHGTDFGLQATGEPKEKPDPNGVQKEDFQKYFELVKLGRGRGSSSLLNTTR
ncbi:mucin-4-like [Saccostrea cucullata]|uniref:mucin-4-like n=1 Tax=Saccostrea cuccullata TaxID=36930 RepID=UPI002ED1216A